MREATLLLAVVLAAVSPAARALQPLENVAAVAAGGIHTCALTTAGGVKCWGYNSYGQLGDNSTTDRITPVDVSGLGSGVAAIAAGDLHTCALTAAGGVKCWGDNNFSALGDGSSTRRLTPVDVSGLGSGVAAIAAGDNHTCALTTAGGVKCWGYSADGRLGVDSFLSRSTPVDVSGLASGIAAIAAGGSHTCALSAAGGVKCWGSNAYGQLGNSSNTGGFTPVDVSGLGTGVAAIATGSGHTCALTVAGGVKCWGINSYGELGDDSTTTRRTPVDVPGLTTGAAAVDAGGNHTCALTTAGGVKCWGRNDSGQLGDNSLTHRRTPVDVAGLGGGVAAIAMGGSHTCAKTTAGGVRCWGENDSGQLGDGVMAKRLAPIDVPGLGSGIAAVAAGNEHTCAITTGGGVKCWGWNALGQLGDNSTTDRLAPVDVPGLGSGVAAIAAGGGHTCALTAAAGVTCWGNNDYGQLGDNSTTSRLTPADVAGLGSGIAAIATGLAHTCAITTGGGVKCWGYNANGQLGDNSTTMRLAPVDVPSLRSGVVAIATGYAHTCALTTAGAVKCWGNSRATTSLAPVDVPGLGSGVAAIAAAAGFTCALTTGGGVKCWGDNGVGQLGDGTGMERGIPTDVSGLTIGARAIEAGGDHTCALTTAGGVKCWGFSSSGQLGNDSVARQLAPVDVSGLGSGVAAVSAGGSHTCALTTAGGLKCWGSNYHGQLGDGSSGIRPFPAAVLTASSANYTALWWNAAESGWGVNFNHQGDIVFGTLFTYDAAGNPMWLVMSNGARQGSADTFSGALYRTTGPAFNANPFTPIAAANLTLVGNMSVAFSGGTGTLTYSVNGTSVTKAIQPQVFGSRAASCGTTAGDRSQLANYQDLWWNAAESGWGINVAHQGDTLFATLFTYNASGQGVWWVMSAGTRQSDGSYAGALYQTSGPAFNANPFTPIGPANVRTVGTMRMQFPSGSSGTLTYTVDGVTVTKTITRQLFSTPQPSCS